MPENLLPPIADLQRTAQSLAMLDAILSPDWEYRNFSFNSGWASGQKMASMRDGSGDEWFILFDDAGAAMKGFAHELAGDSSFLSEIQRQVPRDFSEFLNEPAFSMQHATFCLWRTHHDKTWNKVAGFSGDDGATQMVLQLTHGAPGYKEWAEGYYDIPVNLEAVSAIFAHQTLSPQLVFLLDQQADLHAVRADADEIGYPHTLT
ncbi:hypothetical protein [Comamonas koreensis]|uniref:Uncharacterized protein n=1 Tax=Comamonas koreensis TaxID=160825 RepID=A0AAW4XYS7_9BURK|nr:hypothetical protein [Comamonas koreensis]MCD2166562.1 hypothetical protein [Comamonas koreensis]